jgi:hypothetical protein
MRIFGVLQRFAIAYFVIAVMYIYLSRRSYGQPEVRLEYNVSSEHCFHGETVNLYHESSNAVKYSHCLSHWEVPFHILC